MASTRVGSPRFTDVCVSAELKALFLAYGQLCILSIFNRFLVLLYQVYCVGA